MNTRKKPGAPRFGLIARIALSSMLLLAVIAVAGPDQPPANLLKNGDAETGALDNWSGLSGVVSLEPHAGKFSFSRRGNATVTSTQLLPLDPDKTYTLTGWFKSAGQEPSRLHFGYIPYDADKKSIQPVNVTRLAGTETTLTQDCHPDDTIVKIANGAKWRIITHARIAFEIDDSGQYNDLPNRKLSGSGVNKIEDKGDHWEIHLANKCGLAYPAGTKIGEHISGATFIYNAASGAPVPHTWTKYTANIKGVARNGGPTNKWWRGTEYFRVLMLTNYAQNAEFELLIDDLAITVADQ